MKRFVCCVMVFSLLLACAAQAEITDKQAAVTTAAVLFGFDAKGTVIGDDTALICIPLPDVTEKVLKSERETLFKYVGLATQFLLSGNLKYVEFQYMASDAEPCFALMFSLDSPGDVNIMMNPSYADEVQSAFANTEQQ